jgi:hypothetical protein
LGFPFRLLCLICLAGAANQAYAYKTTCPSSTPQSEGDPLTLNLGYTCNTATGDLIQVDDPANLPPGQTTTACYRGVDTHGHVVTAITTCTICLPTSTDAGCYNDSDNWWDHFFDDPPLLTKLIKAVQELLAA